MVDPRQAVLRNSLSERMARVIKRQRYTERHLEQILRASPSNAKALHTGQLDEFSNEELQRYLTALE